MDYKAQPVNYLSGFELLSRLTCFPMALRAAIDLSVFPIISRFGHDAKLTASQLVAEMPTTNPNAAIALERILRILAANSLLSPSNELNGEISYGLTKDSRYLVPSQKDGVSLVPMVLLTIDKYVMESYFQLKDAVLDEGCVPFDKTFGVSIFEFAGKEPKVGKMFNEAMRSSSIFVLDEVLKVYEGFDEMKELVDVGGGIGGTMSKIVSKYPHIHGINFDLPHVIADAPNYPGVKHISGDMFEEIPKAENIFLKWVLHDWDDESCKKLLRKCWNALDEGGKMIVVELVLPQVLGNNAESRSALAGDLMMMALSPGGKERTIIQFQNLGKAAGFNKVKSFPVNQGLHVIEFQK
nr:scoulerine 9-O-methyltransferase [Corydalis solida]